jgi:hypothetical protein
MGVTKVHAFLHLLSQLLKIFLPQSLCVKWYQCWQLLADYSGQFGEKIRPLRKKISPLSLFEGILPIETKLSLSVSVGNV